MQDRQSHQELDASFVSGLLDALTDTPLEPAPGLSTRGAEPDGSAIRLRNNTVAQARGFGAVLRTLEKRGRPQRSLRGAARDIF